MTIPFVKLHGAKNDFLLTRTELLRAVPADELRDIAVRICNRYTGVGADGWMLIDTASGLGYNASIRLFNSDGSEAELSGNGTRCAAALLAREAPEQSEFRIRTGAGVKVLRLIARTALEYQFDMEMGNVQVLELHAVVQGRDAVLLDVGNPQCAFPVENFGFDWRALGAATERDARFPNRTNVSFFRSIDRHTIEVRFWERGAGETNSSGTGSTGAAVAAVARAITESPVRVETSAGVMVVDFSDGVKLTGPAEFVAEGYYIH